MHLTKKEMDQKLFQQGNGKWCQYNKRILENN